MRKESRVAAAAAVAVSGSSGDLQELPPRAAEARQHNFSFRKWVRRARENSYLSSGEISSLGQRSLRLLGRSANQRFLVVIVVCVGCVCAEHWLGEQAER